MTNQEQAACLDFCALEGGDITHLPTTTHNDPVAKQRPWIEVIDGQANVEADGADIADILSCYLPMGIKGCGFESHLESAYKSLARSVTENEDQFDFVRPDSMLAVVLISDEVDCSYADQSIFEADGNRVFWSDPDASFPTSAVCWNAGVSCVGDEGEFDWQCQSENYDVDGNPTDPGSAVLRPLERYTDQLEGLAGNRPVAVYGILGVGADGQPNYGKDGSDPQFEDDFGIAPGCQSGFTDAVPPVRQLEVVQHFGEDRMHSICSGYSNTINAIGADILSRIE
jgi:hypothetical protein